MRNYIILWIILGLGVFLFLQNVPVHLMGQIFTFLFALIVVWALCSFVYGTLTIFYPNMEKDSWGIKLLGDIARINPRPSVPNTPTTPTTTEVPRKYMTQTEVLDIVDAAFKTFSNKSNSPLAAIVTEEIRKQLGEEAKVKPKQAPPLLVAQSTEKENPAYSSLVEQFLGQREMIFQLEKSMELTNADHQEWRKKLVEQLKQKNAQLLILENQETAIQTLKNKMAQLEKGFSSEKQDSATTESTTDSAAVVEKIEKESTIQKSAIEALYQKMLSIEKRQAAVENTAVATQTQMSDWKPIDQKINKITSDQQASMDVLFQKLSSVEKRQAALEKLAIETETATTAIDFKPMQDYIAKTTAEQQTAMNKLAHKINQIEKQQAAVENRPSSSPQAAPDLAHIYESIAKQTEDRKRAIDALYHKMLALETHQKQLEMFPKEKVSSASDLSLMEDKMEQLAEELQGAMDVLYEKIMSVDKRSAQLEKAESTSRTKAADFSPIYKKMETVSLEQKAVIDTLYSKIATIEKQNQALQETLSLKTETAAPDLAPIYQEINKVSSLQKSEINILNEKLEKLTALHQELSTYTKQQQSITPKFEQMFKNFDEVLAQQEHMLENLTDKMLTEEQVLDLLKNQPGQPENLSMEKVNELIETALSDRASARSKNFVTIDQFQDGLIELAERVEEQLQQMR